MKYEMFLDECTYHMWTVRPVGDRQYNSPNQRWFKTKKDAELYLNQMNENINE